jgi:hypothetical protein
VKLGYIPSPCHGAQRRLTRRSDARLPEFDVNVLLLIGKNGWLDEKAGSESWVRVLAPIIGRRIDSIWSVILYNAMHF